jgi:DNA-binding NarL/FixJ family response regulator
MMNRKHRILLCDDQDVIRRGVCEILKHYADIQVVGEASGGQAGIDAALELLPDLVIMDVSMPDLDGFEATRQIVAKAPTVKVLAYSMNADWKAVDQMFASGAQGFVLKQDDVGELVRAIRTVVDGEPFLSAGLLRCPTPVEERS